MDKVVGIRFRKGGKIYYFDPGDLQLKRGDSVIVHTEQGVGLGQVAEGCFCKDCRIHPNEIKKVERLATEEEMQVQKKNLDFEQDAKNYCLDRIQAHKLAVVAVAVAIQHPNLHEGSPQINRAKSLVLIKF